jgi:hypothetical protein
VLGEPHGDPTLTQHVLHRLTEPKIDPERQRAHELREPDMRPIRIAAHSPGQ